MTPVVDHVARRAIAELQEQLNSERRATITGTDAAVTQAIAALSRRVDELEQTVVSLKSYLIPADPRIAARMAPLALDRFVGHLASELDTHAKAFGWMKARTGRLIAWERNDLRPFCNSVDNRLKFLEMMIEAFVDANPDMRRKFERIHAIIGRVDYSRPDPQPATAPAKDDAR
jgi:hypothetical protein